MLFAQFVKIVLSSTCHWLNRNAHRRGIITYILKYDDRFGFERNPKLKSVISKLRSDEYKSLRFFDLSS